MYIFDSSQAPGGVAVQPGALAFALLGCMAFAAADLSHCLSVLFLYLPAAMVKLALLLAGRGPGAGNGPGVGRQGTGDT